MAFEVTATKKRPQIFDELAGQEFVVSTLKNSIRAGRIAHAYLFSGPRGVGKTSAARILAKALNCTATDSPNDTPCGVCPNCREIASGGSLDVIEIDGASNTSVNDVRRIKDEVLFAPSSSRKKVYIIDEVHMLSNSAFNALLKTIEEPPGYIVFVFATTEIHKVPATIRSRCQQFHFQLISIETIRGILEHTAMENQFSIEDEALFWIAREAAGSMRDAYTLFDQVVSFAVPVEGSVPTVTMEMVRDKMGLVGIGAVNELVEAMHRGNSGEAIEMIQEILRRGVSVEQIVIDMVDYYRSLMLIKQGITSESLLGNKIDNFSSSVIKGYTKEQLEAAVELLLSTYRDIRYSISQRFELELAVSRLADLHHLVSQRALVGQIGALKDQLLRGELTSEEKKETYRDPVPKKRVPDFSFKPKRTEPAAHISAPEQAPKIEPETSKNVDQGGEVVDFPSPELAAPSQQPKKSEPVSAPVEISDEVPEKETQADLPIEITRNHIESVVTSLKEPQPALSAALSKISDWHFHDSLLELIFPDAYTSGKISSNLPAVREALYRLFETKLAVKAVTTAEHDQMRMHEDSISRIEHTPGVDERIELVKSIFRGTVIGDNGGKK